MINIYGWMLGLLLFAVSAEVFGVSVTGRITVGTYDGKETLVQASQGNYSNDVATVSGRFFLRATDITSQRFEVVTDVRDKHDFFGLDDRSAFQLTDKNTLQIRQASFLYPGKTFFTQLGRFPVPEAGASHADGALQGINLGKGYRWAAFGGYNPKRPDQTYLQWNSDSQTYGTYLTFVSAVQDWSKSFYVNLAGVTQIVQNQTDRTYLYFNTLYQWAKDSRFTLVTYMDYVPRAYLQNATASVEQAFGNKLVGSLNYFAIAVLQYIRLQSVRSTLPSSPYKETTGKIRYLAQENWNLDLSASSGFREIDSLPRQEYSLTSNWLRFWGPHTDFNLTVGMRNNFVSNDTFAGFNFSYFSNLWELGLSADYAIENYKNGFGTYHPLISEASVSRVFDNSIFGTISFQDVRDERVQISTLFLKFSYRFGRKEFPPIRDGAPPRGRL